MLVRRARRQARTLIRKRLGGAKGANYSKLSPSERIQLDKRVSKKLPIINKIAIRLLPKVKSAELKRLSAARGKKNESVNHSFERFIADVVHEGTSEDNNRWSFQEYLDNTSTGLDEAESAQRLKTQADKHKQQDKTLDKRQDLAKERLKIQISKQKSAEIRSEALTVAETVDMMIEAIEAIDAKAIKAQIDPDTLFLEYIEGFENPHGKQTPQQGGFAAVNRLVAEMSQAQKDKAEDIVKGMKKKASDFTKRYGDKGEQVMYATANKLAQEDYKSLKSFGEREIIRDLDEKSKGLWANIHAKRKRGGKMNPKGHKDAPTPAEMKKAQEGVSEDYSAMKDAEAHAKKDGHDYHKDVSVQHKYDAYHMKKRGYTHRKYGGYGSYSYNKHGDGNQITSADHHGISEGGNAGWEAFRKRQGKVLRKALSKAREQEDNKANQIKKFGDVEVKEGLDKKQESKMIQLFRMGLAQKGELEIMKRAMKRGDDALKDPKLRTKLYELLMKLIDIVTTDGQIYVKVRQNVQNSKEELQAVEEAFKWLSNTVVVQNIEINHKFDNLFPEHDIKETINTCNDTDQVED
jgi:hypothetical protein